MNKLSIALVVVYAVVRVVLIANNYYWHEINTDASTSTFILIIFAILLEINVRRMKLPMERRELRKKSFISLMIMIFIFILGNFAEDEIIKYQTQTVLSSGLTRGSRAAVSQALDCCLRGNDSFLIKVA